MDRTLTIQEKIQTVRRSLEGNLKFLCKEYLNTRDWGAAHDDLELFLLRAGNRIHIELPRGHLKSWIVTKGWAIQQMLKNPDLRVLIVNATEENAVKFMRTIERFLGEGSQLETYYGRFQSDIWNQNECVVRQRKAVLDAPTFMAAGLQKTLTSQHFDLIIADDLVEPDNVRTKEQREKVYEFYLSLFDLLEPDGRMVVIGTRYHQDDLYARILEENKAYGNWSVFVRSCYNPDGSVLFPEKFTQSQLDDIKKKSFYHFSTQYMNNPVDPENADFREDQIEYYDPATPAPHSLIFCVDPARSLSRDADFSGFTVSGMYANRRIRLCDAFRKKCVPDTIIDTIFETVSKWKNRGHSLRVVIETFAYQMMLKHMVEKRMREKGIFFPLFEFNKRRGPNGEKQDVKNARIRGLQPFFQQHLYEIAPHMKDFKDELLSFPRGTHDDLIDSASMALDHLVPSLQPVKGSSIPVHGSMGWWEKKLPVPALSVYDRFFQDVKSS